MEVLPDNAHYNQPRVAFEDEGVMVSRGHAQNPQILKPDPFSAETIAKAKPLLPQALTLVSNGQLPSK